MMCAQAARWLNEVGVEVPEGIRVEISPLFAIDALDLRRHAAKIPTIVKDTYLREPLY